MVQKPVYCPLQQGLIRSSIFDQSIFEDGTLPLPTFARYTGSLFNEGLFGCTASCPITYFTIGEIRFTLHSLTGAAL